MVEIFDAMEVTMQSVATYSEPVGPYETEFLGKNLGGPKFVPNI